MTLLEINQSAEAGTLLFIMGGLMVLFCGIGIVDLRKKKRRCTATIIAKITSYKTSTHSDSSDSGRISSTTYYPIYTFKLDDEEYRSQSDIGYSNPCYSIGTKIEVDYNPENPYENMLAGKGKNRLRNGVLGFFFVAGVLILWLACKVYPF